MMYTAGDDQALVGAISQKKQDCQEFEQNMKNIIQSVYKIANTGFGYKRMQKDLRVVKILCLALNPLIPASITYHVSTLSICPRLANPTENFSGSHISQ